MNYEFYADVFFLTNFYLDFLAVYMVGRILNQKKRLLRYLLCCALSSLAGCFLLLFLQNYDLYLLCVHFIVNSGMVIGCFFPAEKGIYGKAFCLMYFVILLLGGSVEWLYVTVAGRRYYEICLLFTSVPVFLFLYILRRKNKNVQTFYSVLLEQGEQKVSLIALYDTGNRLIDPYIKAPVHIISEEVFLSLGGTRTFATRLIPFSSVGCRQGMLEAFGIERMKIKGKEEDYEISPATLAVAGQEIFENRAYQMILNGEGVFGGTVQKKDFAGKEMLPEKIRKRCAIKK